MSTQTIAATDVRRQQAEERLLVIRNALEVADQELAKAYAERDWEVFGYTSWGEYCEKKLPQLRMIKALDPDERAEKWAQQVRAGLSQGAVAEGAGVNKATVSRALAGKDLPSTATGLDGKVRSTRSSVAPRNTSAPVKLSGAARVRAALVEAGAGGVTTPELVKRLRLHWGVVSGELSRCSQNGRALLPTVTRNGFAVYIDADVLSR